MGSQSTSSAAQALAEAGIPVLHPEDPGYTERQESYWSLGAGPAVKPACIARPRSSAEVSTVIRTLVATATPFAVRSGGHMPAAGSNNAAGGGVTIDLGDMAWARIDDPAETIDVGPGARWLQVYAEAHKYGRAVTGGRDGNVGVAGLLLASGISYFTARRGFACDNVLAYEVVLADGEVVNVDAHDHGDLFRALKGGGAGNFGIVTNFKLRTFRCSDAWGGLTFYPKHLASEAVDALVDFTRNVHIDPDSNLLTFFAYSPEFKDTFICTVFAQIAGVERAPAYNKWLALPTTTSMVKTSSVVQMLTDCSVAPLGYYNTFFTATFKNDSRIVAKAAELHEQFVAELRPLIPDGDFITQCLFQPLPWVFVQRSCEAGGNVLGLDKQLNSEDGLIFTISVMVRSPELEVFVQKKCKDWLQKVLEFASTVDGNLDWKYVGYSDSSQDPLASYGRDNVDFMRAVSNRYDPHGVFQTLSPGGFKIPIF